MTPVRTIPRRQSTNCQAPRTSTIRQTVSTADALGAAAPAGTSARAGPLAAPLERVARPSRRQSPDSNDVIYELVASHARGAVFGTPHAVADRVDINEGVEREGHEAAPPVRSDSAATASGFSAHAYHSASGAHVLDARFSFNSVSAIDAR